MRCKVTGFPLVAITVLSAAPALPSAAAVVHTGGGGVLPFQHRLQGCATKNAKVSTIAPPSSPSSPPFTADYSQTYVLSFCAPSFLP